jgi:hypothetical protein
MSVMIAEVLVAQHFLLSAKARTLSLTAIMRMSDDEAMAASSLSGSRTTAANRSGRTANA